MSNLTQDPPFAPVIDPDTGELLAASPAERIEVIEYEADMLVEAENALERAQARAAEARRKLGLLMRRGDAYAPPGAAGWAVTVQPARTPPRQVLPSAIDQHQEALTPLGLGPHERTVTDYPKVSELTSPSARAALARLGLSPEQLLHTPPAGPDRVVVVRPEAG